MEQVIAIGALCMAGAAMTGIPILLLYAFLTRDSPPVEYAWRFEKRHVHDYKHVGFEYKSPYGPAATAQIERCECGAEVRSLTDAGLQQMQFNEIDNAWDGTGFDPGEYSKYLKGLIPYVKTPIDMEIERAKESH